MIFFKAENYVGLVSHILLVYNVWGCIYVLRVDLAFRFLIVFIMWLMECSILKAYLNSQPFSELWEEKLRKWSEVHCYDGCYCVFNGPKWLEVLSLRRESYVQLGSFWYLNLWGIFWMEWMNWVTGVTILVGCKYTISQLF